MPFKFLISLVILIPFFTTGCQSDKQNQMIKGETKSSISIYNKKWILVNTDKSPYTAFVVFKEDGKVSGFSGCNTFFTKATISDDTISIVKLASTRKKCAKAMQFESNVISNLSSATHYKISSLGKIETLYLYQNQTKTLTFTYQ